ADGNMHKARRRIEKGHLRRACNWPDIGDFSDIAVNLDQRAVIAGGIETLASMIDVKAVGAAGWQFPIDNVGEIGEACDQHHRRLADAEVYPFGAGIGHAPARPSRQIDRVLRDCFQIDGLQHRTLLRVANARGYADARASDNSGAVGPWPRWEYGFDLV